MLRFMSKRVKYTAEKHLNRVISQRINMTEGYWSSLMANLQRRYEKVCQENICLTEGMLVGFEKYPIEYWNNPAHKLGVELKDISVAGFFFKSAYRAIESLQLETKSEKKQVENRSPSKSAS